MPSSARNKRVTRRQAAEIIGAAEASIKKLPPTTGNKGAVLHALRHKPLTSIQTFEAVKAAGLQTTSGSIYQVLRDLVAGGFLVKITDEDDGGVTKWKLVVAQR